MFLVGLNLLRSMSEYLNLCFSRNAEPSFTALGRSSLKQPQEIMWRSVLELLKDEKEGGLM